MGQSEHKRKSVDTVSMPNASLVCDKVSFDKVSLVDHSKSHLKKGVPNPRLSTSSLASLQHDHPVSRNSSVAAASSEKRVIVACQNKIPRMTDYSPPQALISYFGSLLGSHPSFLSTESSSAATSSLSYPLYISQLGTCRGDFAFVDVPLNKQKGGEKSSVKQVEKAKEIIVISDDEENDPKSDVDLTLKL